MKKSIFVATLTASAVLLTGACNKHSWDSTKKIYTGHGHGDEAHEKDHDHKDGDKKPAEDE